MCLARLCRNSVKSRDSNSQRATLATAESEKVMREGEALSRDNNQKAHGAPRAHTQPSNPTSATNKAVTSTSPKHHTSPSATSHRLTVLCSRHSNSNGNACHPSPSCPPSASATMVSGVPSDVSASFWRVPDAQGKTSENKMQL